MSRTTSEVLYSPFYGSLLVVKLAAEQCAIGGAVVSIEVIDSGPGVPLRERTRVFEPFYRMAGVVEPGHGLGLALIRHIAAAHAGRATFLPVGVGAHLRVELPVWQASAPSTSSRLGS